MSELRNIFQLKRMTAERKYDMLETAVVSHWRSWSVDIGTDRAHWQEYRDLKGWRDEMWEGVRKDKGYHEEEEDRRRTNAQKARERAKLRESEGYIPNVDWSDERQKWFYGVERTIWYRIRKEWERMTVFLTKDLGSYEEGKSVRVAWRQAWGRGEEIRKLVWEHGDDFARGKIAEAEEVKGEIRVNVGEGKDWGEIKRKGARESKLNANNNINVNFNINGEDKEGEGMGLEGKRAKMRVEIGLDGTERKRGKVTMDGIQLGKGVSFQPRTRIMTVGFTKRVVVEGTNGVKVDMEYRKSVSVRGKSGKDCRDWAYRLREGWKASPFAPESFKYLTKKTLRELKEAQSGGRGKGKGGRRVKKN
jgi:hypothetical protein